MKKDNVYILRLRTNPQKVFRDSRGFTIKFFNKASALSYSHINLGGSYYPEKVQP